MKNYLNDLDIIRINKSSKDLKNFFNELLKSNFEKALKLINDPKLQFPSLFLLQSEIHKFKILNKLSHRNRVGLEITNEILTGKEKLLSPKKLSQEKNNYILSTLKWIFITGISNDGLNKDFDRVVDITTVLLTKEYKDISILPTIVSKTFERYKKDYYFYDLIWAFFQSRNPQSLTLIAPYLLSKDEKDVELATRLLNFIPDIDLNLVAFKNKKYFTFMKWFRENYPFLYFTGESFQRRYNPKPYILVSEGKYLCKPISVNTGKIINPLTNKELQLLKIFKKEPYENKKVLSDFSYKLYKNNIYWWYKWINSPLEKQLDVIKGRRGGLK